MPPPAASKVTNIHLTALSAHRRKTCGRTSGSHRNVDAFYFISLWKFPSKRLFRRLPFVQLIHSLTRISPEKGGEDLFEN